MINKKIGIVVTASNESFQLVRTSIFHFIDKNKWFTGKIFVLVDDVLSLSKKNIEILLAIYAKTEIIIISDKQVGIKLGDSTVSQETLIKTLSTKIFSSEVDEILYFSMVCLFVQNIQDLIQQNKVINSKYVIHLHRGEEVSNLGKTISSEFVYSSSFTNSAFSKKRSHLNVAYCIIFDTSHQSQGSKFTKIHQIWLQANHKTVQFLQDPKSYVVPKNKISLELMQLKQNSKIQKKQTAPTQKKTVLLRNEPLIQREPFAIKDIDKTKVRATVAMPLFNMGQIATLALEGLCNQKTDYLWELVVCEEVNDKCLGRDVLYSYEERLRQANCVEIKYKGLSQWIPLSKKWHIIASMSADTDCFILQAGDCYAHSKRIECTVNALATGKYNYYDEQKGYFYSFKHNKTILFSPNPTTIQHPCRLNMAWKTSLFKKLPAADVRRGVDGFIYSALSGFEKIQTYRNVGPYEDGVDVDGYNMISSRDASFLFLKKKNPYIRTHIDMVKALPILNNYKNLKLTVEKIK